MECPACKRSLLNVKARQCPACAAPFVPSQFAYAPGSVRFCCPHCDQAYAGTGARGELVPRRFTCVRCAREIDMDEMVVRPAEPVMAGAGGGMSPAAPPITAGMITIPPEKPAWPAVIGIIAIVFGAGGVLGGLSAMLMPFFMNLVKGIKVPGGADMFSGMDKWIVWIVTLNIFGALIASVLLVGGIGMVKRRAWSGKAIVAWAIVKILFAIPLASVTAMAQHDQMTGAIASMKSSGTPPPPAFFGAMTSGFAVIGVVFGVAWAWALPVFMLIWLTRRANRSLVASWRAIQV